MADTMDKELKKDVKAVEKELDKQEDLAQHIEAERLALGFAPPRDDANPLPREERERRAQVAMDKIPGDIASVRDTRKALKGSKAVDNPSDLEIARRFERARGGDARPSRPDSRTVILHGTPIIVDTGDDVKVPGVVADILANAAEPMRTAQMRHGGVNVIDLREDAD